MRASEPEIAPPSDPLAVSPEIKDAHRHGLRRRARASPEGTLQHKQWFPYYEERRGDYRLRLVPPLLLEQTRGLPDPTQALYGIPKTEDTEGLYGLLYYRRRSLDLDMDVALPGLLARARPRQPRRRGRARSSTARRPARTTTGSRRSSSRAAARTAGYFHSPAAADDVALGREGRLHARRALLPRPHGQRRRPGRRAVLLPRRQRQPRGQPPHVHAHPAAPLLPLGARARLEQHHRRRPGHRAVERRSATSSTWRRSSSTSRASPRRAASSRSTRRSSRSSTTGTTPTSRSSSCRGTTGA